MPVSAARCIACGRPQDGKIPYPLPRSDLFAGLDVGLCRHCGMGAVLSAIDPDRLHQYYVRDYAHLTDRHERPAPAAYFASREAMFKPQRSLSQLRLAAKHLPDPPRRILDLGAGFGTTLYLAKEFWAEAALLAVEPDSAMAPYLQHIGAEVVQSPGQVEAQSVDLVIASHVLEHYQAAEVAEVLQELRRLLAPGGIVVAEVPNSDFVAYPQIAGHSHEPHLLFFSPAAFSALFTKAGFSIRFASTVGSLRSRGPLLDLVEKVRRRIAGRSEYGPHRSAIRLVASVSR